MLNQDVIRDMEEAREMAKSTGRRVKHNDTKINPIALIAQKISDGIRGAHV